MKNKISIKVNCFKGFPYEQTLSGIKNAGFNFVELSTSNGNSLGLSQDMSLDQINNIKDDLNKRKLTPIAIGGNSYIMDDDTSKIISNIKLAELFECKYIDTTVFNARNDKGIIAKDEDVIKHIQYYIPYLEQYNKTLVIELHGEYSTGKSLINILKTTNNEHIKINYDTGNVIFYANYDVEEMMNDFSNCINYVGFMHLKDKLDDKSVWNFPAIGKGYIPFEKIFEILQNANNSSPLIVEIEFTEKGVKDIEEVNSALLDSANYLQSLNIEL